MKTSLKTISWPWRNETKPKQTLYRWPCSTSCNQEADSLFDVWLWHPSSPKPSFSPTSGLALKKVSGLPLFAPIGSSNREKQGLPQALAQIKAMVDYLTFFLLCSGWNLSPSPWGIILLSPVCAINFILCKKKKKEEFADNWHLNIPSYWFFFMNFSQQSFIVFSVWLLPIF